MKRYYLLVCLAFTVLAGGSALAASPPTIEAPRAANVGATTAVISAATNCHEQKCRVWIEYSTHADLSNATRASERVLDASPYGISVNAFPAGLQPNTVYYFRGYAKNYDGEVYSAIGKLKTAAEAAPPSVQFRTANIRGDLMNLELACNGGGLDGTCSVMWSTSADMSGAKEIKSEHMSAQPTGSMFYATFNVTTVQDNTHVYFQGVMKTARGVAKSGIVDKLIRNKPI